MIFSSGRCVTTFVLSSVALAALGCGQNGLETTDPTSSGAGGSTGSGLPAKELSVVNWNVHNFLNDKNDSAAPDEVVVTAASYQKHRDQIAGVLKALDADIVVLQEIENKAVLDDLNKALGNAYDTRAITSGNDPRGINIAVLSRLPLDGSPIFHAKDTFVLAGTPGPKYSYSRDCLELHLTYNQRKIALLGVHLKSKATPDDPDKRLAEAQHTRAIADTILAASPTTGLIVLGDFNDVSASMPVQAAEGSGATALVDAADSIPEAQRYTYTFNSQKELIDHQLGSSTAHGWLQADKVLIRHGSDVNAASDHSPLLATYLVN